MSNSERMFIIMSEKKRVSGYEKTLKLVLMGVLTAIIILMAFTPIGYLKTAGLEITFIMIPVIVGAVILGPAAGAVLGAVFGITSFVQCFGLSPFGAALLGLNPVFTFITCLVPRILMGFLSGLIFKALKNIDKTKFLSYFTACLCGPVINTVLFMLSIILFFWNTDFIRELCSTLGAENIFAFVALFVGINGIIEAAVSCVLGTAIAKALSVAVKRLRA